MEKEAIKKAVEAAYERIAAEGSRAPGGLAFPTGEALALSLGYPPDIVAKAGRETLDGFVGAFPLAGEIMKEGGELTVADLGCGSGLDTLWLAGAGARVVSLDASRGMLRNLAAASGECEAVEGFLPDIPLKSDSFTHVLTNGAANLVFDKQLLAKEVFRILKPGGRWLLADVMALGELGEELRKDPEAWAFCVGGAVSPGEWEALCLGAGFREAEVEIVERFMPLGKGVLRAVK
ncbi:methyltransferase domain-containing protein [bacterium]|nr:MAG: methyltransferase domain-containing protein [bacterium]